MPAQPPGGFALPCRGVCLCAESLTISDEVLRHVEDYAHREAAGQMRGVNQTNHAADDTDESQGGLIDGTPWGTCCWQQTHKRGAGGGGNNNREIYM